MITGGAPSSDRWRRTRQCARSRCAPFTTRQRQLTAPATGRACRKYCTRWHMLGTARTIGGPRPSGPRSLGPELPSTSRVPWANSTTPMNSAAPAAAAIRIRRGVHRRPRTCSSHSATTASSPRMTDAANHAGRATPACAPPPLPVCGAAAWRPPSATYSRVAAGSTMRRGI